MKKDLRINEYYAFADLPSGTQSDFLIQYEDEINLRNTEFTFLLKQIDYDKLLEEFDEIFGPNLLDYLEEDYIKELACDIKQNGLVNPPIGLEGYHRCLAYLYLEEKMPYFEIIRKEKKL